MKSIARCFLLVGTAVLTSFASTPADRVIVLDARLEPNAKFVISPYIHAVFAEVLGSCVYDGIWVGRDSPIPNVEGIRQAFIEGCIEAGVTAIRWPGGVFADHYHWKYGIGPQRKNRLYSATADLERDELTRVNVKGNEFGTDEFIRLCRLIGCEPILVANTATGTPEELLDWFEYCNGDPGTYWGARRAEHGHAEPYNVFTWALGNTDDNAWHIAHRDPLNYARDFLRFRTAIRRFAGTKIIGLGYSLRHHEPGWVGEFMEYVTKGGTAPGPDSLSVHHYSGGGKSATRGCGPSSAYSDEQYYYSLGTVDLFRQDIAHHRAAIEKYTRPKARTTICFDEWGFWHPDTGSGLRQAQTVRDALFAALSLHLFYRECDIVEYAMATQVVNVLHSLFETKGAQLVKTPTFYVFKLLKSHRGQQLLPLGGWEADPMLDSVMSASADRRNVTLSIVNKDLAAGREIHLPPWLKERFVLKGARTLTSANVRDQNTWDHPTTVVDRPLEPVAAGAGLALPRHSLSVFIFSAKP